MKRRMKKSFILYCILTLLAGGCSAGVLESTSLPTESSQKQESPENPESKETDDLATSEEVNRETTVLTYGTMQADSFISSWIVDFNKTQDVYRIEIKEYGTEDYETGIMQLNADLAGGNAPDIIDLSDIDFRVYQSKGILADLSPFLQNDPELSEGSFVDGALQMYGEDGRLYAIPAGITMETLMGRSSQMGSREEWTLDEFRSLLSSLPKGTECIENLYPSGLLRIFLQTGMDSYIDWEKGECFFEEESFIRLLESANALPEGYESDESTEEKIAAGILLLERAYINDIADYLYSVSMFGEDSVVCLGFPSEDGGHTLLKPYMPLGILESSGEKQGAWEFVRSLLCEEFQRDYMRFQFPTRRDILQEAFDAYLEGNIEVEGKKAEQGSVDQIMEMLRTGKSSLAFRREIWNIIIEDAESYFNDEKTSLEAAQSIQRRVNMYLSELN